MAPSAISPPSGSGQSNSPRDVPLLNGNYLAHAESQDLNSPDDHLDLLCVGFGPASLAIAIALHDAEKTRSHPARAKTLFLERQPQFAWHAGMQLPGAKMQISFLKDLATPRDPTSQFTFVNYLFQKGRFNTFVNLGTFLPSRLEYEDYLRWCASHFEKEGKVAYGMDVEGVRIGEKDTHGRVTSFAVTARAQNGEMITRRARHVVIAVGGRPVIPLNLQGLKHVSHSSQFANAISKIQAQDIKRPLRFAVIGSGQSAAEIFSHLWSSFPDAQVSLVIKGASLRPSDDSPFVNEIFDPDRVDKIYHQNPSERAAAIALDRGTNYGVVRLELLEHLYEKLYMQSLQMGDEARRNARILPNRTVLSASQSKDSAVSLRLGIPEEKQLQGSPDVDEHLEVDYVFTATGYRRNAHEDILSHIRGLIPDDLADAEQLPVGRDYRVKYDGQKVDGKAGIWLQGCNEGTHGLSDTLLSILAVRGGELVKSIFGEPERSSP